MKLFLPTLLLLLVPLECLAETTPTQFADGFAIDAPAGGAVYRLTLDEEVYRSARHADLGDLRVFNGGDEPVPHSLLRRNSRKESPVSRQTLPFYPLYADSDHNAGAGVHIAIGTDGSIIDLNTPREDSDRLRAYIVDAGQSAASIAGLDLQWQQPADGFLGTVAVSSSSDLGAWRAVGSATLVDLDHGGHRLQQRHIELSQPLSRYLRIEWPAGRNDMPLEAVHAHLQALDPVRVERWSDMSGEASPAPERGFRFDALAALPVTRARIVLDQDNTLVELRWYSRSAPDALWHDHGNALAYRLNLEGTVLSSPDLVIGTRRDRYWRVDVVAGDAAALGARPRLELGWQPDELRFMARGEPPFQLAAGALERGAAESGVDTLLAGLDAAQSEALIMNATLGPRHTLGGAAALRPATPPTPWQRYLLWSVLIAAVLMLARMALHLYREISAHDARSG